ncbi:CDP-diacylglycerol-inositol 3-phosphatidyltransferase, eukaryote [Penicillium occitanis (nom. inval.)]|nr:CDP-diacylglycerol-inositol 3-phosphatidyltransferase, eukaryote [Penicillium occitanis (nom. inval.)]PCH09657.1 hypothetical protein PENOC_008850 [Penicillium occitanis (nom. inval.)]
MDTRENVTYNAPPATTSENIFLLIPNLVVFLAVAYPNWSILFQCLISLDFASHFMHVYATLAMGTANQSHKKINQNRPWAMRIYYSNVNVLFAVCLFNELFFITLYLISFSSRNQTIEETSYTWTELGPFTTSQAILCISGGFMLFKQYVNILQMVEACKWIAEGDGEKRKQMRVSDQIQKKE